MAAVELFQDLARLVRLSVVKQRLSIIQVCDHLP
jgi:hypothetical protein